MTLKEFLKELEVLKGKYKLDKWNEIRAIQKSTGYCPIVGLAKKRGNKPETYYHAAAYLGLKAATRDIIVEAADNYSKCRPSVRRSLLKALGL